MGNLGSHHMYVRNLGASKVSNLTEPLTHVENPSAPHIYEEHLRSSPHSEEYESSSCEEYI